MAGTEMCQSPSDKCISPTRFKIPQYKFASGAIRVYVMVADGEEVQIDVLKTGLFQINATANKMALIHDS